MAIRSEGKLLTIPSDTNNDAFRLSFQRDQSNSSATLWTGSNFESDTYEAKSTPGFLISDGTVHQYGVTWDGSDVRFYRDGALWATAAHTGSNLDWKKTNHEIAVLSMGSANNTFYQPATHVTLAFIASRAFATSELASIWQNPDQLVQ
jgi:hypothetical protein